MLRFYTYLWLFWLYKISRLVLLSAFVLAFLVTLVLFFMQGAPTLTPEILQALLDIYFFWFSILLQLSFVFGIFLSASSLLGRCFGGYEMRLRLCQEANHDEQKREKELRKTLHRVSRKLLFLIVWISATIMVLLFIPLYLFGGCSDGFFSCFHIYLLDAIIIISGFFAISLLALRCKNLELVKCSSI